MSFQPFLVSLLLVTLTLILVFISFNPQPETKPSSIIPTFHYSLHPFQIVASARPESQKEKSANHMQEA